MLLPTRLEKNTNFVKTWRRNFKKMSRVLRGRTFFFFFFLFAASVNQKKQEGNALIRGAVLSALGVKEK